MTDTVTDLLSRNLASVFGESDPAKRREAIAAIWAEDGLFVDPHGRRIGHAAVDEAVAELHAAFPGFGFVPLGEPQAFFEVGRLAWGHGPAGEAPKVTGLDVAVVRDGRIAALYTFIDPPAGETP